jgi:crotonobetainyl-CoA:carnitine CoA-transferase CaiB-like acyl-CoA transferase
MELYQRVSLIENIERYGLKKGDVATLVDFVDHPQAGEKGCVLEIINALGDTIDVITLPCSSVELLKSDEILSVRHYSKAV